MLILNISGFSKNGLIGRKAFWVLVTWKRVKTKSSFRAAWIIENNLRTFLPDLLFWRDEASVDDSCFLFPVIYGCKICNFFTTKDLMAEKSIYVLLDSRGEFFRGGSLWGWPALSSCCRKVNRKIKNVELIRDY